MIPRDENTTSRPNGLSGDEARIAQLLAALPRVDASKDFDFRLKARIAQRRSAPAAKAGYIRALAFIAPVVLVLMAASLFFFLRQQGSGEQLSQAQPQPVVQQDETAKTAPQPPTSDAATPRVEIPATPAAERQPLTAQVKRPAEVERKDVPRGNRIRGGSFDVGVEPRPVILPRGFDPNTQAKPITEPPGQAPKASLGDALRSSGAGTSRGPGGWTVSSVAPGSASERAGLKKGDVIESGRTDANGTHLTVSRGGSKVQLTIRP